MFDTTGSFPHYDIFTIAIEASTLEIYYHNFTRIKHCSSLSQSCNSFSGIPEVIASCCETYVTNIENWEANNKKLHFKENLYSMLVDINQEAHSSVLVSCK